MSYEQPNQDNLSEDQFAETNEMIGNEYDHKIINPELQTTPIINQYMEKLAELTPIQTTLKNYIEAKEHIDQTQFRFDQMNNGSAHAEHSELQKTAAALNQYKLIIENYEQDNNVPAEDGLGFEKKRLQEIESEMQNLRGLVSQFDEKNKNYKKN